MRNKIIIVITVILFSSCEKVIDYPLDDSKSAIVIEASLTNDKTPISVVVSKTSSYFGGSESTQVTGATVSVKADNGKQRYFSEVSPGTYQLDKVLFSTKNWYTVYVEYEGVTYSARSYLHEPVPVVECSVTYFDGLGFFASGYKINCFIKDPPNIENFYRLKLYVNGRVVNNEGEIDVYPDKLFDGKVIGLVQNSSVVFSKEDTVIVELQAIDKAAYTYFSTLESISGLEIIQSASPSNPISNFNNGALGYFSAYSFERRTIIISNYIKK